MTDVVNQKCFFFSIFFFANITNIIILFVRVFKSARTARESLYSAKLKKNTLLYDKKCQAWFVSMRTHLSEMFLLFARPHAKLSLKPQISLWGIVSKHTHRQIENGEREEQNEMDDWLIVFYWMSALTLAWIRSNGRWKTHTVVHVLPVYETFICQ